MVDQLTDQDQDDGQMQALAFMYQEAAKVETQLPPPARELLNESDDQVIIFYLCPPTLKNHSG